MNNIPGIPPNRVSELCAELVVQVSDEVQRQLANDASTRNLENVRRAFLQMDEQVTRMGRLLNQERNKCTPIGRLAEDTVLEILRYCQPAYDLHNPPTPKIPHVFSFCTRWRNIALHQPELWSRISLPIHPNLRDLFKDRNGTHPLDVHISNAQMLNASDDAYQRLGVDFVRLLPRVSCLCLNWESTPQYWGISRLPNFMNVFVGGIPFVSLKSLRVKIESENSWSPLRLNTPILRKYEYIGLLSNRVRVSTTNLVSFRYESPASQSVPPTQLLDLLSEFCHLEDVAIKFSPALPMNGFHHAPITFPKLRNLSLDCVNLSEVSEIMRHIQLPSSANQSFIVSQRDSDSESTFERFLRGFILHSPSQIRIFGFQSRLILLFTYEGGSQTIIVGLGVSAAQLTFAMFAPQHNRLSSLDLDITPLPSLNALIVALRSFRLLTRLKVCTTEPDFERLLQALEYASVVLCPALKNIDCSGTPVRTDRIDQFLEHRRGRGAPLDEVRISQNYVISANS
ncbi:hypothetical protein SISNIDRAFT_487071 [Sistotremastrum niveocremeum HHB9708]|uniref:F-box domain-containing protein n=1 Tax=Sistotremastrum niveocremeum HHB9708 TaxID=1314777 RepID=A0A164SS80_9AGAM|nr:hypothetical protein SISNIDRAFT_487071 [Sistotremastrum niveocremeum HHB9708]